MVVDIGVIENGACITFDDFSMLEIVAATSKVDLKETSHLNLLNGLQLDDIVTTVHQSLYTNWVGVLSIYAVNGWKLDFKIMSQDVPSVGPFHLELKVNNAVR
jgi:sRNA-binding regulator protein Hfq